MNLFIILFMLLSCTGPKHKKEQIVEESVPCGWAPGEIACSFEALNQSNIKMRLHEFEGKVILLDFSTVWCYWCNVAAMEEKEIISLFDEDDLVWITVLVEDKNGNKPTVSVLKKWADKYGIDAPVLGGDLSLLDYHDDGNDVGFRNGGFPTFVLINKKMRIVKYFYGWQKESIIEEIEGLLNE